MKKDANKPQEANIEEIKAQELRPEKKAAGLRQAAQIRRL